MNHGYVVGTVRDHGTVWIAPVEVLEGTRVEEVVKVAVDQRIARTIDWTKTPIILSFEDWAIIPDGEPLL